MSTGTRLDISPFPSVGEIKRRDEAERQSARQNLANKARDQNDYTLLADALGLSGDQGEHF